MIDTKTLKKYLQFFGKTEQNNGQRLYKEGAVVHVEFNEKGRYYHAVIKGENVHAISLKYKSPRQIISGICTCPSRTFCEHQVALIIHLLYDPSLNKKHALPLEGRTSELRKLGISNFDELQEVTSELRDSVRRWAQGPFKYEVNDQHTVLCYTGKESDYGYISNQEITYDKPSVEIQLLPEGKLAVKCHDCDKALPRLCDHAVQALDNLVGMIHFERLYEQEVNYDIILSSAATQMDSSSAILKKYCRVLIDKKGFIFLPKDSRLLIGEAWDNFISTGDYITSPATPDNSSFLYHQQSELTNQTGNALAWSPDRQTYGMFFPIILEGKLTIDGLRLKSNIEKVPFLRLAPKQQTDFYYEFEKVINTFQTLDLPSLVAKLHTFLGEHSDTLSSFIHYFHDAARSPYYKAHDELKKSDLRAFIFSPERAGLRFEVHPAEDSFFLKSFLAIGTELVPIDQVKMCHSLFVLIKNKAYLYKSPDVFFYINSNQKWHEVLIDKTKLDDIKALLFKFSSRFDVGPLPESLQVKTMLLADGEKKLLVKEYGRTLTFEPVMHFEKTGDVNVLSSTTHIQTTETGSVAYVPDDEEVADFIEFMDNSHPEFKASREGNDFYYLTAEQAISHNWFLDFFEACQKKDIQVYGDDKLQKFKFNKNKAVISTSVASGIDWFDLNVDISFGKQKLPSSSWIEAIRNKESYVRLSDGSLGVLPETWISRFQKILDYADVRGGAIKISKLSFNVVEDLFKELGEEKYVKEIQAKKARLAEFTSIKKFPVPPAINATLRDYQKKGFQWLKFLDEFKFGGCLADDMGLGKTLQVITFLADQKKLKRGTSLVVVPRSLLFNWAAEIDKFCPSLTYEIHHGPNRVVDGKAFKKKDLIISTYDTITIDIESIRQIEFNYCILDESQAIKNPHSKRYKAMRLITATNRLVMTGTPIENNTFDLYSQFSFINPGLFLSQSSFKARFSNPIDVRGEQEAADLLRQLVYPFLLRRTKEQVAADLPEKTESTLMCVMEDRQRKLYDELKMSIRADLEQTIDSDGLNKARFKILEGLLRLRQVCNSPLLVNKTLSGHHAHSAKLDLLMEHVEDVTLGHKVLIFSQFTSMLALIKERLEKRDIQYTYLDGSTKDREGAVNEFQHDESSRVFLVSLKAGNTGLNLTSAEYVYIVDPWWNPAVEAQAIDRTHRIGQDKHVFAYRLICKDTIEEKILKLQDKKRTIASDIIRTDERILKSLTKEKLMALFD